jgi:phage-related protein
MSMGSAIHKVVGEPSETVIEAMNQIGNWFQEASYAARDFKQGNMNVREETMQAVKSVVSGDDEDEEDKMNPPATAASAQDEKKQSS